MRTEHAKFNNGTLTITKDEKDPIWNCFAYYKKFKDGVHQEEVWFRTDLNDNPDAPLWTLDGADLYEIDCLYEQEGWRFGFCYNLNMKPSHEHSIICVGKGLGIERELMLRSIKVIKHS